MGPPTQETAEGPRGLARGLMWLLKRVSPRHAAAAERESREWFFVCPKCGTARSYWEMGGVRYKAASRGKRLLMKCPTCGVSRWNAVKRRRSAPVE